MNQSENPLHVAIIMDGNGRWARRRGLPRTAGHKQGAEAARRIIKAAPEMGVRYLTLFGFSSENWSRPASEVQELMRLLRFYLRSETAELHKNGARVRVIGDRAGLDDDIVELIKHAESLTRDNDRITLIIALNYGGRHEIAKAAHGLMRHCRDNDIDPSVANVSEMLPSFMMTADVPDPDLLIRTSGEQRISNFLLWQCAYAELYFTPVLWPDFSAEHLAEALEAYNARERRFGAVQATKG